MDDDLNPPSQARVVPDGEPIVGGESLFSGSLEAAKAFVRAMPASDQAEVAIVVDGAIYDPTAI